MTVPEENRPKTDATDDVVMEPAENGDLESSDGRRNTGPSGRTLREAMEEAGIDRDDFEDR
ncbi:hypothetical protein ABZ357_32695 [Streptomyces sp. NPDC005917]|uniref:hypothetical protein n=1 Tax=unclassified Streptomyces TaxID=2593676 RepID=UPI0033D0616C